MNTTARLAIVLIFSASLGCCGRETLSEPSIPKLRLEESLEALDAEVLATVLGDLLTYAGEDSPVAVKGSLPSEIHFASNPDIRPQTVNRVLYQHEEELWRKLTPAQATASREAAEHLAMRIEKGEYPAEFKTQDERIRSSDRRRTRACPPGYAADRRFAVVRLSIPWSIHHVDGTYLLREDNRKWTVCLRQFVYYL